MSRSGRIVQGISSLWIAALLLSIASSTSVAGNRAVTIGENAPGFSAIDLDGKTVRFEDVLSTSSLVVLNFWGVRCGSCLEEMPHLSGIHARFSPQKVKIIGVNVDGMEPETLKNLLVQVAAIPPYLLVTDKDFRITDLYSVSAVPLTIIVLPNGKIVFRHEGFTAGDEKNLEQEIIRNVKSDATRK